MLVVHVHEVSIQHVPPSTCPFGCYKDFSNTSTHPLKLQLASFSLNVLLIILYGGRGHNVTFVKDTVINDRKTETKRDREEMSGERFLPHFFSVFLCSCFCFQSYITMSFTEVSYLLLSSSKVFVSSFFLSCSSSFQSSGSKTNGKHAFGTPQGSDNTPELCARFLLFVSPAARRND